MEWNTYVSQFSSVMTYVVIVTCIRIIQPKITFFQKVYYVIKHPIEDPFGHQTADTPYIAIWNGDLTERGECKFRHNFSYSESVAWFNAEYLAPFIFEIDFI